MKKIIDGSEGLVCWTVARTACFQTKKRSDDKALLGRLLAEGRRNLWNNTAAFFARAIAKYLDGPFEKLAQDQAFGLTRMLFFTLESTGA